MILEPNIHISSGEIESCTWESCRKQLHDDTINSLWYSIREHLKISLRLSITNNLFGSITGEEE